MNEVSPYSQTDKKLQEHLLCPVLKKPLTEAVTVLNCGHKIQKIAAEYWLGPVGDGWKTPSKEPCPVCRVPAKGYIDDHSTREIAKILFILPENEIKVLVENCKSTAIPYPGKPAKFERNGYREYWEKPFGSFSKINVVSSLLFTSLTEDSLIENFWIGGYEKHSLSIVAHLRSNTRNIKDYFKQFEMKIDNCNDVWAKNHDHVKALFNILVENNEISESHIDLLRDAVKNYSHL